MLNNYHSNYDENFKKLYRKIEMVAENFNLNQARRKQSQSFQ